MRIDAKIVYIFLAAMISLQGWMLKEIVTLKEKVAAIGAVIGIVFVVIFGMGCATNPATGKSEFLKPSEWFFTDASGTNVNVRTEVGESIETGKVIGGILPSPANQIVTGVSTLAAALLGLIARYKSGKLVATREHLEQREEQLLTERTKTEALIKGVESGGNKETKQAIEDLAVKLGVLKDLHSDVKLLTAK